MAPRTFDKPDLGDANPPAPDRQGDMGTVHMQETMKSSDPRVRMSMASQCYCSDEYVRLRGYRTEPIGGTFMPDNGVQGASDGGSMEKYSV